MQVLAISLECNGWWISGKKVIFNFLIMKINLVNTQPYSLINIALRCPHCWHNGTFLWVSILDLYEANSNGQFFLWIRKCPNTRCNGHLFFIADSIWRILLTSPSETIPFDKNNIPQDVLNAFEEAIKCHSHSCFIASAIMIRKTLEEICTQQWATWKDLKWKLQDLGTKILIPKELISAMTELRLLGNDAAHIEGKTFNEIWKEEIEISLEFTQEILKAVYQYESLLKKLQSLKK